MLQSSRVLPASYSARPSPISVSSFPAFESAPIWASQTRASNSAIQARNAFRSSGESFWIRSASFSISLMIATAAIFVHRLYGETPATAASQPATQQRFADGNDWTRASLDEKRTFLFEIANAISVAIGWDERHVPAGQVTFSRRASDGLAGTSLGETATPIRAC